MRNPPPSKLTRRQRIAHAALVELQREAAALERRIQREVVEAYARRAVAENRLAFVNARGGR